MLEFDEVDVQCYNLDYLVVSWSIVPTTENISLYTFSVWRSESPEGPFAKMHDGLVNVFSYKDADVELMSKWRKFYYKIRCTLTSTPSRYVESEAAISGSRPDPTAIEIVSRNNMLLRNFTGVSSYVFIRRTFGQRCQECWDEVKQRKTQSNCPICYNTGFVGGFHLPVSTRVNYNPSPEMVRHGGFTEQQVDNTYAWLSNVPLVNNKDVIVQDGRLRWRVTGVNTTRKLGLVVHQMIQLVRINQNDIEYTLAIPGAE